MELHPGPRPGDREGGEMTDRQARLRSTCYGMLSGWGVLLLLAQTFGTVAHEPAPKWRAAITLGLTAFFFWRGTTGGDER